MALSPDGRRLAGLVVGGDGMVRVWDLKRPGAVPTELRSEGVALDSPGLQPRRPAAGRRRRRPSAGRRRRRGIR